MSLKRAKAFIDSARWKFAWTLRHIPHYYTVRDWHQHDEADFEAFIRLIRATGYALEWGKYHHTYLDIGEWRYWTMGAPVRETTVLNREHLYRSAMVNRMYDKIAADYDTAVALPHREIAPLLPDLRAHRVLDIGCGTGKLLEIASAPPLEYVGIDPAEAMLEIARRKFPDQDFQCITGQDALDHDVLPGATLITAIFSASYVNPTAFAARAERDRAGLFLVYHAPEHRPDYFARLRYKPPRWLRTIEELEAVFPGAAVGRIGAHLLVWLPPPGS